MKTTVYSLCLFLFLGAASPLISKPSDSEPDIVSARRVISDGHPSEVLTGGTPGGAYAKADTVYLLGGPDRDDGDFEDGGQPSWDGWSSIDLTSPESHWQVSNYYCQDLDPTTIPNHAWWCGQTFEDDCGTGDFNGYGNDYNQWLEWYGEVPNPLLEVTVTLNALLNYDCEVSYDYLYLKYDAGGEEQIVQFWTGTGTNVSVSETLLLSVDDFVPHPDNGMPAVHLMWHFDSDDVWSDEDCLYPSLGAAQIDLIEIIFDQGTPIQVSYEDNENQNPQDNEWKPLQFGVGDFAKVWPLLEDIDPCSSNPTPVVAFIDNGEVVPGTGGYQCISWCYGPGGYVVNPEGGLLGPEFHINNAIESPILTWPGSTYNGAKLSFDVYRHHDLHDPDFSGTGYFWEVQSTDSGSLHEAPWKDYNFWYNGGPDWYRFQVDVSVLLEPGRQQARMRLGVYELGWAYGWSGTNSTPAPYFDNVAFIAYQYDGPAVSAREIDLFQDNFPESGTIDFGNLGANHVRLDMALNISSYLDMRNDPGDSVIAFIEPIRAGSELIEYPRMYFKIQPNPLFDPYREGGFSSEGYVEGDSIFLQPGFPLVDKFSFDLPDSGWFFPGDVLHWYIEARDSGSAPALTLLPADTTGFSLFPGDPGYEPLQYPSSFIVRALPSIKSDTPGDHPKILFWNDFGSRGGENEWLESLSSLGFIEGVDYDLYYTNGPSSGVGNGLGGRASASQLSGYNTILYTCGDLGMFTISNGDYDNDPSEDVDVLDAWLLQGDKNLFLTGDNLISDLENSGASSFVFDWIGVDLGDSDLKPLIGNQDSPLVKSVGFNPVFDMVEWIADGGCPDLNDFDAVTVNQGTRKLAEFTDPSGAPGAYPYAAASLRVNPALFTKVIYLPTDLMFIESAGGEPSYGRSQLLADVLAYFDSPPICPPDSVMFVDSGAAGYGDGSSWEDAYPDLASALDHSLHCSEVTQIWVAEGTYRPTASTDRAVSFRIRNNLAIYGGFEGNETELSERDFTGPPTVLSGDIGAPGVMEDNSYQVVKAEDVDNSAVMDGFTVTGGYGNSSVKGGGIFISDGASPVLSNIVVSDNISGKGGGIYIGDGHALLTNIVVHGNEANDGGGLFTEDSHSILRNALIFRNSATDGGGLYNRNGNVYMVNVTISRNFVSNHGGGIYSRGNEDMEIVNSIIYQNDNRDVFNDGSSPTFSFSIIQDCGGSGGNWDEEFGTDGGHNEEHNPSFEDPGEDDFHLTQGSNAIDAGYNNAPNLPILDLDGNARIVNGVVDMGAYEFDDSVSGVYESDEESPPLVTQLYRSYPNPFNPMTTIRFDLSKSERVSLRIYDVSGRLVRVLFDGDVVDAGRRESVWKGRDESGRQVAAGVYFYRFEAGVFSETKRMTLIK